MGFTIYLSFSETGEVQPGEYFHNLREYLDILRAVSYDIEDKINKDIQSQEQATQSKSTKTS